MIEQGVTLCAPDGAEAPAVIDLERYGPGLRAAKATAFILAGLAGGAACIIVPGLHFVTTWGLPLLGIFLGVRALRTRERILRIRGACPACGEALDLHGDARACPACRAGVSVKRPAPAAPGAAAEAPSRSGS